MNACIASSRRVLWISLLLLAGCSTAPAALPPATSAPAVEPPAAAAAPSTASAWQLDDATSALRLRVYRSGTLARLGHNHIIVAPLRGTVWLEAERVVAIEIETLPAQWRIDEPQERQRAGAGFESTPDANAIAGTRANLLSLALLDVERFPRIVVRGTSAAEVEGQLPLALTIELQARAIALAVPLRVVPKDKGWKGEAIVRLTHSQLGLTPFSALSGALRVDDAIDVEIAVDLRR